MTAVLVPTPCRACGQPKMGLERRPDITVCVHCDAPCDRKSCGPCRKSDKRTPDGPT